MSRRAMRHGPFCFGPGSFGPPDEWTKDNRSQGSSAMVIPEISTTAAGAPAEEPPPLSPFNLRNQVLGRLYAANVASGKTSQRAASNTLAKMRAGLLVKPAESLGAARALVQDAINAELAGVIDRYVTRFLHPAIANIRENGQPVAPGLIDDLRIEILEEAKKMYRDPEAARPAPTATLPLPKPSPASRPKSNSSAAHQPAEERLPTRKRAPPQLFSPSSNSTSSMQPSTSALDSDADSDVALPPSRSRKKPRYLESIERPLSRSSTPGGARPSELTMEDLPKWNPIRVKSETCFILGSKANKALGMGDQRGRIYNKHPRLFKYVSDAEDKDWLFKSGHKGSKGIGRAFLLFLDDVSALAASDEYRANPGLIPGDLVGFAVPLFLQEKIKTAMRAEYDRQRVKLET